MIQLRTYAENNQFRFKCPIFGVEVKIRECLSLRDMVWKGEKVGVRRGCQACIHTSKCPMVPLVYDFAYRREGEDVYHSTEPRVGHLQPSLLARIAQIIVPNYWLDKLDVPPAERSRIALADPKTIAHEAKVEKKTRKRQPDALAQAAMTGDMGAALNKAMEAEIGKQ
jgi:hypothetical protein